MRHHFPSPHLACWLALVGSAWHLAPALARALDQIWWKAAWLLGPHLMCWGLQRWIVEVGQVGYMWRTELGCPPWWGPAVPSAPLSGLPSQLVLALGVEADIWLGSGCWPTELFNSLLQSSSGCQGLPVGLSGLSKFSFAWSVLGFLPWRLCPSGGMGKCWQVLVLCFPWAVHLSSTIGSLLGKPRCPLWPLVLIQACMMGPRQPLKWVHLVEKFSNLLQGGLVSYQLDGRCICLWVQPVETMSVAAVY